MGLAATIGQSIRVAGTLVRLAEANSSRESGLKEAVRFTAERRGQVAMFQQKTPEVSALVTVFLGVVVVVRWDVAGIGRVEMGAPFLFFGWEEGRTHLRSPWWSWLAENIT